MANTHNDSNLPRPRILLLADTPNLYRSAVRKYGPAAWLDYAAVRQTALRLGAAQCEAVVNGGVSVKFVDWLKRLGYAVTFSHAEDVDEMLIARAVAHHRSTDILVIASGDGKNVELIHLFKAVNKRVVVAAIPGSIHRDLHVAADEVLEFPLKRHSLPSVGQVA